MSFTTGNLLGISITLGSKKKILEEIEKYLISSSRVPRQELVIVTPNPEQIVTAWHDKRFGQLLNKADIAIPDGVGVAWALRFLSIAPPVSRIPGIELFEDLAGLASKRHVRTGLIGGNEKLAVRALECLKKRFPSLEGEATGAPEFQVVQSQLKTENIDDFLTKIVDWITQNNLQMIFVGLGAPKQEMLIDELVHRLSFTVHRKTKSTNDERTNELTRPIVFMSVGGSFDILAGRISRAPLFIRMIGFEWFWRLLREPWRWRRQLALVEFVFLVLRAKIRSLAK